jgi:hypothetical protein
VSLNPFPLPIKTSPQVTVLQPTKKPCAAAVVAVTVCPERDIEVMFTVIAPSEAAPVVVEPAVEAAVKPPLRSRATTL